MKLKRSVIGMVILTFAAAILAGQWYFGSVHMYRLKGSALQWYPIFSGHEFDSVGFDEADTLLILYQYLPGEPNGSVFSKVEVERVMPDRTCNFSFNDACSLICGVLFSDSISWNGEWSGLYVSDSALPDALAPYCEKDLGENVYYLRMVPDSIL